MASTILTLTMNPALDLFLEVSRVEPDKKLRTLQPIYRPGGGGINVSRAIRHLRGLSTALFPSGGTTGELIATLLERESIPTHRVFIADPVRENINISETSTGREYRFILPGPDLGRDDWRQCLNAIDLISPKPEYVVASGSLPPGVPVDFYARLAALAIERRFRLIVDTSGEPLRHTAVNGMFLLKPNLSELAITTRAAEVTPDRIEDAARILVEKNGVNAVVVSLGTGGAILVDRDHALRVPAPPVNVVSRIGAGDSMVAGLVLALARGDGIDDAVRYGVAAGSAAVTTPGHQLCAYETTEKLYAEMRRAASGVLVMV